MALPKIDKLSTGVTTDAFPPLFAIVIELFIYLI